MGSFICLFWSVMLSRSLTKNTSGLITHPDSIAWVTGVLASDGLKIAVKFKIISVRCSSFPSQIIQTCSQSPP